MKRWLIVIFLALLPAAVPAADKQPADPGERKFPADYHEAGARPETGKAIRKHAEDAQAGAQKNFGVQPVHDNEIFAVFRGDRLEYHAREGEDTLLWDVQGWVGSDYDKLYFKSEGAWLTEQEEVEEASVELLYGRNVASFWDLQAGIRHDFRPKPTRTFAALGVQGTAPYWFEVDATAYVSEDGDVSADIEVEYDILLSQRLILQPRLETRVAVQGVEENGVGRGINDIELGARLRYEMRREFAPYAGVSWSRKLGETGDLAEEDGEDIDVFGLVFGIKFWF